MSTVLPKSALLVKNKQGELIGSHFLGDLFLVKFEEDSAGEPNPEGEMKDVDLILVQLFRQLVHDFFNLGFTLHKHGLS